MVGGNQMTISHGADDDGLYLEIQDQLKEIKEELAFIKEHIVKSAEVIEKVGAEVMPTINGLMDSPMIKAIIGKKLKK
jgi:hypothetical protein